MKKFAFTSSLFFALNCLGSVVRAEACPPNNPSGLSENTLCIRHHLSLFKKENIDHGSGVYAHHGPTVDPLRPGVGTPFNDKKLEGNEFYTSVSVGDKTQGIRVETNKGTVYTKSK